MNYGKYTCFTAGRQGRVLTLTINRPDDLKAVNKDMHDELGSIFYDAQLDDGADVIVLTGAGRAFSAGGDMAYLKRIADGSDEPMLRLADAKRIIFSLLDLEKPIIAAVNGHAMGLGATIAYCAIPSSCHRKPSSPVPMSRLAWWPVRAALSASCN